MNTDVYMSPSRLQKLSDKQEAQNYLRSFTESRNSYDLKHGLSYEKKMIIRDEVEKLDDESKAMIHLKFWENLQNYEIAGQMGKTLNYVDKRLPQILSKLRPLLMSKFIEDIKTEDTIK